MGQKMKGMGGHMTAALLHEISWLYRIYDFKIRDAWMHNKAHNADQLAKERDAKVRKLRDRLAERGYDYVMPDRPAVRPSLSLLNEGEKMLAKALIFAELIRAA